MRLAEMHVRRDTETSYDYTEQHRRKQAPSCVNEAINTHTNGKFVCTR